MGTSDGSQPNSGLSSSALIVRPGPVPGSPRQRDGGAFAAAEGRLTHALDQGCESGSRSLTGGEGPPRRGGLCRCGRGIRSWTRCDLRSAHAAAERCLEVSGELGGDLAGLLGDDLLTHTSRAHRPHATSPSTSTTVRLPGFAQPGEELGPAFPAATDVRPSAVKTSVLLELAVDVMHVGSESRSIGPDALAEAYVYLVRVAALSCSTPGTHRPPLRVGPGTPTRSATCWATSNSSCSFTHSRSLCLWGCGPSRKAARTRLHLDRGEMSSVLRGRPDVLRRVDHLLEACRGGCGDLASSSLGPVSSCLRDRRLSGRCRRHRRLPVGRLSRSRRTAVFPRSRDADDREIVMLAADLAERIVVGDRRTRRRPPARRV